MSHQKREHGRGEEQEHPGPEHPPLQLRPQATCDRLQPCRRGHQPDRCREEHQGTRRESRGDHCQDRHRDQRDPRPGDRCRSPRRQPPEGGPRGPEGGVIDAQLADRQPGGPQDARDPERQEQRGDPQDDQPRPQRPDREPEPDPAQQRAKGRHQVHRRGEGDKDAQHRARGQRRPDARGPGAGLCQRPGDQPGRGWAEQEEGQCRDPPATHRCNAGGQDGIRQRHRDPVPAGPGLTQGRVAAQEGQRYRQPERQPEHKVDRAQERHADRREQRQVRRHREGAAEPGRVPAGEVAVDQVHGAGSGQQPTSAQGASPQERPGIAHECGQCQGPGDRQRVPDATRRRPPGPRRGAARPGGPAVQGVRQGGAPTGADLLGPSQVAHRGLAQAAARAVDPPRMTQDPPRSRDLRGRLLRLTREQQRNHPNCRRQARADVAPGQRQGGGLAQLEDQLAGTSRASGMWQSRAGPNAAMAGLPMCHDRSRDEHDLADRWPRLAGTGRPVRPSHPPPGPSHPGSARCPRGRACPRSRRRRRVARRRTDPDRARWVPADRRPGSRAPTCSPRRPVGRSPTRRRSWAPAPPAAGFRSAPFSSASRQPGSGAESSWTIQYQATGPVDVGSQSPAPPRRPPQRGHRPGRAPGPGPDHGFPRPAATRCRPWTRHRCRPRGRRGDPDRRRQPGFAAATGRRPCSAPGPSRGGSGPPRRRPRGAGTGRGRRQRGRRHRRPPRPRPHRPRPHDHHEAPR